MGMKALLNKAGFSKRSGTPIYELVYVLVLWVWLKKDSIGMFARESSNIIPFRRPFFFLIQLVVVLI
jgi:hypothetical protein